MTIQEEEGTKNASKKQGRDDGKIARRDYVVVCIFLP